MDRVMVFAAEQCGEERWNGLGPAERVAAMYQALCRLDTGCKRTGQPSDASLPPCRASAEFRRRRGCTAG
jgi:hypothetical protein